MKKIILSSAFILGTFILSKAQELKITNYENNTIEYGNVSKGADGKRIITVQNIGDKPLVISSISTSCGCTVPKWTEDPIAPGATGEITVTYNTANLGSFHKTITVNSNDVNNPSLALKVQGTVISD
ncbi:DUF1573 domain-containing protein [Apibacter adventoris]|uniref:DUF1573 domain-containing protein n=1 Tax=Apibacter adventoris TaxID=1679466 RepID=A0A2S8A8D7_9FLAO|nr:DUF1573 domain-containing protein [Apibacter adventoris]PQL90823.1 hypothetical protein C4S77_10245 [Apibacter adventoris]